jgi:hypothetical protein
MHKIKIFTLLFIALSVKLSAQPVGIGQWRVHLPYGKCISIAEAGDKLYCATPTSIFYYLKSENSVGYLNKVNGLSDVSISKIAYYPEYKSLVIAYSNANIDILTDGFITNISDIKRKEIFGNKTINNILFKGKYAYLSCGFGIVVVDLIKFEINDTYYIGTNGSFINVYDLANDATNFYAATEKGIFSASLNNNNLADYSNWKKDTTIQNPNAAYSQIECYFGKIVTSLLVNSWGKDSMFVKKNNVWSHFDSTKVDNIYNLKVSNNLFYACFNYNVVVYDSALQNIDVIWNYNPGNPMPNDVILDTSRTTWIADRGKGLVKYKNGDGISIKPNGPGTNSVFSMTNNGEVLYVAPGGYSSSWGNNWNTDGIFSFIEETWYTLKDSNPQLDTLFDLLDVVIDPSSSNKAYACSWARGLLEFNNGFLTNIYNSGNSLIELPFTGYNWTGIGGLAFDQNNNLWMVNSGCNYFLKVKNADGSWDKFNFASVLSQPAGTKLMIDSKNYKWIILTHYNGLAVFFDNNTSTKSDDRIKLINSSTGSGSLPSNYVLSYAEDKDGEIWIGTDKGVAVIYNPENIFNGGNFEAQPVTVMQDGTPQHLLEFESVTCIAIDGANKKWFGTEKAGVFYMSADGVQQINHFTEENSPLLSNNISSISINNKTGEVFFGTAKGICSYKGKATEGGDVFDVVYAYPNPVRENFEGSIGIKGLVKNAYVKITDVNGTLIYETRADGGQAVWNGKNFSGERAKTGVYLVFCTSEDGKEKLATKILIIN